MIFVHFQGKTFNIKVIQVYALTNSAEEAEVEQFYEDLQDLLELTPKQMSFSLSVSVQSLLFPTLCDLMKHNMPGLPVRHQHPEFTEIHVHWVGDAI